MGGGLWRNQRKRTQEVSDQSKAIAGFKDTLKHDTIILADVRRQLEEEDAQHNEGRDTQHLHASEICKHDWCPRSSWYRITGVEADSKGRRGNILIYREGHDIHDRIQGALWRLGRLTGDYRCLSCKHVWWSTSPDNCEACGSIFLRYAEVPIEDESIRLLGAGDGIIEGTRFQEAPLLEIKSIGVGTIRIEVPGLARRLADGDITLSQMWGEIHRPFPTHVKQIMLYLRARNMKRCVAYYQNKWDQGHKEFLVKYQDFIIEPIIDQCKTVVDALANDTVVRRPEWAEDENTKTCKGCAYRRTCWKLGAEDGEDVEQEDTGQDRGRTKVWVRR